MWSAVECARSGAFPRSRGKHSATLLEGHVYVLGGRGCGGNLPLKDFWKYSLEEGTWRRIQPRGDPPPSLQEHSAVARGHCLYVFGGEAGAFNTETPLWQYNTQSGLWRKLSGNEGVGGARGRPRANGDGGRRGLAGRASEAPRGRRGHSAHTLDDCMLLYGGYRDMCGSTNELWAFHYQSEVWRSVRCSNPGPHRHGHAAVVHKQRLYLHGGCHDLRPCADTWYLDTQSRTWCQIRPSGRGCPSPRSGHVAVRAGGWMYVFGGSVRGRPDDEMWRFHFASESWERTRQGATCPSPRADAAALLVGECLPASAAESPAGRTVARVARHLSFGRRSRYSALPGDESPAIGKSRSAHVIDERGSDSDEPLEADEAEFRCDLSREPLSVPDFGLLPVPDTLGAKGSDSESSTSAYESAEAVCGASQGFCNPHYLGGDVRRLGDALTPDSGVCAAEIEMREIRRERRYPKLHIMLVGGRERPHAALISSPLSMWTYRLL